MKAMYSTPISIREARNWLTAYISESARIPHGSRCLWVAGCKWVTDQPGAYLISGAGGLQGVIIQPPAVEQAEERAS